MPWNNDYDDYYENNHQNYLATEIYNLRKEGHLEEARQKAEDLILNHQATYDVLQAYAWTLIDICKIKRDTGEIQNARSIANHLSGMSQRHFIPRESNNEFAKRLVKSIDYLCYSLHPDYAQIQEAKGLSQKGNNDRAIQIYYQIMADRGLPVNAHTDFGWAIYRYLKDHFDELSKNQVNALFSDYINLQNEKPSLLHSLILNMAFNYSKKDEEFCFISFFAYLSFKQDLGFARTTMD